MEESKGAILWWHFFKDQKDKKNQNQNDDHKDKIKVKDGVCRLIRGDKVINVVDFLMSGGEGNGE